MNTSKGNSDQSKENQLSDFEKAMKKIMNTSKEDVQKAIEEDKKAKDKLTKKPLKK